MDERLRLLLVNDDPDQLFLLEHAMQREFPGCETIPCQNGATALTEIRRRPVDLVVTDHRMPVVSGIELVQQIRGEGFPGPIVMLTGSEEKRAEAMAAGVTVFTCSAGWPEIRQTVRDAFERTRPADGRPQ